MLLHSELTVLERAEHSFDPSPRQGAGAALERWCSIVYSDVDLVVRNDTSSTWGWRPGAASMTS